MKQIYVDKPGGYQSLVIREGYLREPDENEYVIEIKCIGINYADIIIREGYYTAATGKYPIVPGFEYSGVVVQAGKKASEYSVGDSVCGFTLFGAYSTHIIANETSIRPIPKGWSFEEAAGLLVTHLTAYHALRNVAHVKEGETLLVHSAAGGVGTSLIQQAKEIGCRVIGVVGSSAKVGTALRYGADEVLVRGPKLWKQIDTLAPAGLDVVFDANGLTTPRPGYDRLKLGGRLLIYGFAELFPRGRRPWKPALLWKYLKLPKFPISDITSTNRAIMGLNIAFLVDRTDLAQPALDYIVKSVKTGTIEKPVCKSFSFEEIVKAQQYMESGESIGKIVLKVD